MPPMSPIQYLKQQLNFGFAEWAQLSKPDQEQLRQWAAEEMAALKLEVK